MRVRIPEGLVEGDEFLMKMPKNVDRSGDGNGRGSGGEVEEIEENSEELATCEISFLYINYWVNVGWQRRRGVISQNLLKTDLPSDMPPEPDISNKSTCCGLTGKCVYIPACTSCLTRDPAKASPSRLFILILID